MKFKPENLRI